MRCKPTWLWAIVLWAACGGSAYKMSQTGGNAAGGAGGTAGTSGSATGGTAGTSTTATGGSAGSATGGAAGSSTSATGGTAGSGGSATGGTAGSGACRPVPPCPSGWYQYSDTICSAPRPGSTTPCQRNGDGLCYPLCQTSADCTDPRFPTCGSISVFNGSDAGMRKPVCMPTAGLPLCPGAPDAGAGGTGGTGGVAGAGSGGRGGAGGSMASGGATSTGGTSATTMGSGGASGTGGASGSGGTSVVLQACNSSDGSGCGDPMFCVDTRSDSCTPDTTSGCTGFCAARRRAPICAGLAQTTPCPSGFACIPDTRTYLGTDPTSICVGSDTDECTSIADCPTGFACVPSAGGNRCSPDQVVCEGPVTCKRAEPERCPAGYARSTPDGCYGPCVPVEFCACSTDAQCAAAEASCDRKQGRCYTPKSPEPRCQLAFDVGPCDGAMRVYAFIDGACKTTTYGGCAGNDNRFSTLEECLSRCQGMPGEQACPDGRAERVICLGCGAGGGCIQYAGVCAKTCATQTDCQPSGLSCASGYCEAAFCI